MPVPERTVTVGHSRSAGSAAPAVAAAAGAEAGAPPNNIELMRSRNVPDPPELAAPDPVNASGDVQAEIADIAIMRLATASGRPRTCFGLYSGLMIVTALPVTSARLHPRPNRHLL